MFEDFDASTGGAPLAQEEPTGDQLQALREVIQVDKAPYTDFAVWGPFGRRQAKVLKYTAMVWVGNELVSRQLSGPSCFITWRRCWRVFRTAMILIKASRPGPLDEHEEKIRTLAEFVGESNWGVVARADDVMRSEVWEHWRRKIESRVRKRTYQEEFTAERPWEAVLREGARDKDFWQENVKDVLLHAKTTGKSLPAAALALNAEVAPEGSGGSHSWGSGGEGRETPVPGKHSGKLSKQAKKREARGLAHAGVTAKAKRGDGRHVVNSKGVELCFQWNRVANGCEEKCSKKISRQCEWCLGPHRAVNGQCSTRPEGWTPKEKM